MDNPNGTGTVRIFKAAVCSCQGFAAAFRHEAAFRQELVMAALLAPLAFFLADSRTHLLLMLASLVLLLLTEMLNSAVEALADAISLERRELLGRAKDMGSAAVFLASCIVTLFYGEALLYRFLI